MDITPEEMEKLMKLFPQEDLDKIMEMAEIEDEGVIPVPSKSMSTEQYAKSREASMFERMPLDMPQGEVEVEKIEDEEDEGLDIIMYSDFIEDEEESEEESSSQYYSGDEENSQIEILKELENSIGAGKEDDKWYPHVIDEDETIVAYGHKITAEEKAAGTYDDGITEEEAVELLKIDIGDANRKVRDKIKDFDSFPFYLKMELVNSAYRGLIQGSPDTLDFINEGNFEAAADEFTNNVPAYKDSDGIKKRMDRVVDALRKYAQELDD
jgi:hypothetical protein